MNKVRLGLFFENGGIFFVYPENVYTVKVSFMCNSDIMLGEIISDSIVIGKAL